MSRLDLAELKKRVTANMAAHDGAEGEHAVDLGQQHVKIRVDSIDPNPYQPRKVFDEAELEQLTQSIKNNSLLQPIVVRRDGDRYQLIAGERRWRAHQRANKATIEAIVRDADDMAMAVSALVENIDRSDLSDYEISKGIQLIENETAAIVAAGGENPFKKRADLAACLGIGREDLYKFLHFASLPDFILEKLEANPRLLGRRVASDIKSMLASKGDDQKTLDVLRSAIDLVEKKELDQSKIIDFINRASREKGPNGSNPKPAEKTYFTSHGARVGSIRHDGRNVIFTVKEGLLDADKQKAVQEYIARLLHE